MGQILIYHINPGLKYLPKSGLMEFVFRVFQDNILIFHMILLTQRWKKGEGFLITLHL